MDLEVKVGMFVTLGVGLVLAAILILGSTENMLARKNRYHTHFPTIDGLVPGAKVAIGGVQVGTVVGITFNREARAVRVDYTVMRDSSDWIRKDSTAEIMTQGMLGDKFISLKGGSPEMEGLVSESEIPNAPSKDISQFLSKGDQLMVSLNSIASTLDRVLKSFESDGKAEVFFKGLTGSARSLSGVAEKLNRELDSIKLKSAVDHLNGILEKINNGQGTLGALVNDPGLYDDAKALLGGANRNRMIRNLVRQTVKENQGSGDGEPAAEPSPKK